MSVVPDFVEVETAWRTWKIHDGLLSSVSFPALWEPGEPMAAECRVQPVETSSWQPVTLAEAVESQLPMSQNWKKKHVHTRAIPAPPTVVLPEGMQYIYQPTVPLKHASPHVGCHCGIYATEKPQGCAGYGKFVLGRVSLWGKVIPGEKGRRAEFAYPSELFILDEPITVPQSSMTYFSLSFSFAVPEEAPSKKQVEGLEEYGVPVHRVPTWRDAKKLTRIPEGVR